VPNDHSSVADACCGSCQNSNRTRPRLVIGVFRDAEGANGAVQKLRVKAAAKGHVLSSSAPLLAQQETELPALSILSCGRLYQHIARHLEAGASIVVVDAQSPEQQLGVSRVLLESKCDMLLTHDGGGHPHAD
jgi:hypothetical protein